MKTYDFIGIGIGPFNLSVAALAEGLQGFRSLFLECKPYFAWHPGIMVPDCAMQTSFLKDLVSAVDPTNRYSFINYLVQHKKFYRFLTTEQRTVTREEFSDYLSWAAGRLSNLLFSQKVTKVRFDDATRLFTVETNEEQFQARHVCLGIGKQAKLPDCVTEQSDRCFHASEMMLRRPHLQGQRVTLVGGGQSGADLFLNIFRGEWGQPAALNWVSRRNNFNALDEAAFANEYFTPDYLESFSTLNESVRRQMLNEQKMTSDGITSESLLAIYRAMYHRFEVLRETVWAHLLPSRTVTHVCANADSLNLTLHHQLDHGEERLTTDVVIFATGYRPAHPACLAPIAHRLQLNRDESFQVNTDFTLNWRGPKHNHLFAVNAGMQSLGIAEPQLSLMAWRAARILNRAHADAPFDLTTTPGVIRWRTQPATQGLRHAHTVNSAPERYQGKK